MAENSEEKPQETQSETVPWQSLPQNDMHFQHTSQPQNETAGETEKSKEMEEKRGEIESKFNEFLKAIREETSQLAEFIVEEKELTNELCNLLTQILRSLKISFNIPPEYVTKLGEAREIKLSKEGYIIKDGDKANSKLLKDYPPDVILKVMWVIIPELEKAIKVYRKNICKRVSLLEKIKHELKNLQKAVSLDAKETYRQRQDEEIRKSPMTSESWKPSTEL